MATADAYGALGVARGATDAEVRAAFHARARELHPDRRRDGGDDGGARRYAQVQAAWAALREPADRRRYDAGLDEAAVKAARVPHGSGSVVLAALARAPGGDGYEHPCRCGSTYSIPDADVRDGYDAYECEGCSLELRVALPDA